MRTLLLILAPVGAALLGAGAGAGVRALRRRAAAMSEEALPEDSQAPPPARAASRAAPPPARAASPRAAPRPEDISKAVAAAMAPLQQLKPVPDSDEQVAFKAKKKPRSGS